MKQFLLAGLKIVAVLGIALIVVAFSAGVLYALVSADRSDDHGAGTPQASVRASSDEFESEPLVRPDQGIRTSSPKLEDDSGPESDEKPLRVAGPVPKPAQASPAGRERSSELTSSPGESPQSATQGERAKYYTVQEGDTLYGIAREVYGAGRHWEAIYEANRDLIDNARDLRLSWKLEIPPLENAAETN